MIGTIIASCIPALMAFLGTLYATNTTINSKLAVLETKMDAMQLLMETFQGHYERIPLLEMRVDFLERELERIAHE